jgi:hypothetical protein
MIKNYENLLNLINMDIGDYKLFLKEYTETYKSMPIEDTYLLKRKMLKTKGKIEALENVVKYINADRIS